MRLLLIAAAAFTTLAAQSRAAVAQSARSQPSNIIAINPFLPLAASFDGEFERKLRPNLAVAVGASLYDFGVERVRYADAEVKLRLYPMEKALEGFAIAAGVGVGRQSALRYVFCPAIYPAGECTNQRRDTSGPTFAVEMHYQWLLGRARNTAVTVGGGAKRYFIDTKPEGFDVFNEFRPTVRLTIGYAFR